MLTSFFERYAGAGALAAILIACYSGSAQTITGSINGVVTDQTGAIIPNVTVTATNVSTGVKTTGVTSDSGNYSIRFLQIGQYTVTVDHPGFKLTTVGPFTLEVNQTARVDIPLAVGQAAESVVVENALQPILDTDNSTISATFPSTTIQSIPLNGRNFSSVTMFVPGAVATEPTSMTNTNAIERSTNQGGQVSINGNRNQTNSYLLDGIEINETINNVIGYNPSPDAIKNLTVVTSNAGAEYGNVNGGDVIAVLQSGTNHFHGSAFGFLENYNLDANTWANNFAGVPRQPFTQTIFGGTLGGPVKKDKFFFFVNYEGVRYHKGGTQNASVIPAAFRQGDFSSLLPRPQEPTFRGVQLTHFVPGVGQVPYPNNQVPITNPVAQYLFANPSIYPLPNRAGTDAYGIQNNYIGSFRQIVRNDQGDVKIDYTISTKDSIMGRYSQGEASDSQTQAPLLITFPTQNKYPFKGVALNWVHTFSPHIVNEARAGWSRIRWEQGIPQDFTGVFGLSGNQKVGINSPQPYPGFALQDFAVGSGTLSTTYLTDFGTFGGGSSLIDNIFTYGDNLTWQKNTHTMKMGVEILRYQQNNFYPGNDGVMGRIQYSGAFTGSTIPDFVTDQVWYAGISANTGRTGQRQYRIAAFFQDDWKATSNLTLNLGVRYEFDQPIYEVNNKQANVFLATGVSFLAGQTGAGIFGNNRALYSPVYTNVMPRIGFAYQAKDRFVVRGGYGITNFLEGTGANLRLTFNPPFQPSFQYQALPASPTTGGTPISVQTGFGASAAVSNTYRAWVKNLRPAFIQEFTLGIQYQLSNATSASVAYVGQTGQRLINARAGNQLFAPNTTAPFAALVGQNGSVVVTESESNMNYNSAQVQVRHRQSAGLEYIVNYTFSKALTNNPGFFGTASINGASPYWQNAYDGAADYGPSGFDTRHNLSATGVYQLPFGRGKTYGAHASRLMDQLIGGWKITGTAVVYSGFPVTIAGPNNANVNSRAARADHVRPLIIRNQSVRHWFGTDPSAIPCDAPGSLNGIANSVCAYAPAAPNTFGSARVGSQRAPGYQQIDLTGGKAFNFTESQRLEFRADFFNAFNFASYKNPDNNISDGSSFGQITDVRSPQRQIQFALRYEF
jgi:Carboxypeptidase regulatory-like domain/TonB dependent receptor/TonB-dependent Receptor Plug Domain